MKKISRPWVPAVAGYVSLVIGFLDVLKVLSPRFGQSRVAEWSNVLPGIVSTVARASSLVVGILLIMIAHALRRRKVRAWRAVVVLLPVSATVETIIHPGHLATVVLSLILLVGLVLCKDQFYALSDPRTRWAALWNLLAFAAIDLGFGYLLVSRPTIEGDPDLYTRMEHVVLGLVGVEGDVHYSVGRVSDLVYFALVFLGVLTAVTTLYLALRPERPVARRSTDEEKRLRELLDRHGERDSLGYFALRRDKSVLFSPSGKAAIAYRVVSGVMLASGDPIGDPEAWPAAIKVFMSEARRHAWVPAVIGCGETGGEVWTREGGMSALEMGDEAIVDVADFTLQGRAMRNVRQMANRVERAGYTCRMRRVSDLSQEERNKIKSAADSWRSGETERGFSMALGRFGDPSDADCMVVTAHKDDEIRAVLHYVPWGPNGISLDLMRRDRDAEPGLNELLIVKTLQAAPEFGITHVSLNFAMFRAALAGGERLGAGPILRAWRGLLVLLSRWYQIESLYRFNAKFRPIWEPRFLVYPKARDLPRIAVGAMQAEAFITLGLPLGRKRSQEYGQAGTEPEPAQPEPHPVPVPRRTAPKQRGGHLVLVRERSRSGSR
ncbi:phosphatidylglycerol lysyltransferase domain-containing protein [Nonomuraea sediminis]|uniref:phosphatidylglycerol lysyltransferase domain-containing protein n=1 Tax=Nonomuraea sediminis TaxID=2835864 RepID=UPI001BDBF2D8|nr:phosphatidylglycerol lysyltransferase domain-containing protein [Nonomuraea sediminis]